MSEKIYVVEKEQDKVGRIKVVYAGSNATEAADIAEDLYVPRDKPDGPLETFINVWENGEHQFVTRERNKIINNE